MNSDRKKKKKKTITSQSDLPSTTLHVTSTYLILNLLQIRPHQQEEVTAGHRKTTDISIRVGEDGETTAQW
jgi:hypothetical protein